MPNQVIWRFRRKVDEWDQEDRPDPLKGIRDAITPLIDPVHQAPEDTSAEKLTNNEAHVGIGSEIDTNLDREDLRGVRWSRGCELVDQQLADNAAGEQTNLRYPIQIPARSAPPGGLVWRGRRRR